MPALPLEGKAHVALLPLAPVYPAKQWFDRCNLCDSRGFMLRFSGVAQVGRVGVPISISLCKACEKLVRASLQENSDVPSPS